MSSLRFLVLSALSLVKTDLALTAHSAVITGTENVFLPSIWSSQGSLNEDESNRRSSEVQRNYLNSVYKIPATVGHEFKNNAVMTILKEAFSKDYAESLPSPTEENMNDQFQFMIVKGNVRDEREDLFEGSRHAVRRSVNVSLQDAGTSSTASPENALNAAREVDAGGHSKDLTQDATAGANCSVTYFASENGDCALALEYNGAPPAWFMEKILPDDLGAIEPEDLRAFGKDQACGCPPPDVSSTCPESVRAALAILTAACDGGSGRSRQ